MKKNTDKGGAKKRRGGTTYVENNLIKIQKDNIDGFLIGLFIILISIIVLVASAAIAYFWPSFWSNFFDRLVNLFGRMSFQ